MPSNYNIHGVGEYSRNQERQHVSPEAVAGSIAHGIKQSIDSEIPGRLDSMDSRIDNLQDQLDNFEIPDIDIPDFDFESRVPAGIMQIWPHEIDKIPDGWLPCDGRAVNREEYPELFDAIGTKYGSGDGSTTFNLPNLNDRVPVGVGPTVGALATTGGEAKHTLTIPEMPSHNHTAAMYGLNYSQSTSENHTTYWSGNRVTYKFSTEYTGGGGAHNNLQPYVSMYYIISTGKSVYQDELDNKRVQSMMDKLTERMNDMEKMLQDKLDDSIVATIPAGMIQAWPNSLDTIPEGWLVCQGQAVSRTEYPKLFAAIGTMYGPGDDLNTFNLPDLMNRIPVGYGGSTVDFGKSGGEVTHLLSVNEMPSHTHNLRLGGGSVIGPATSGITDSYYHYNNMIDPTGGSLPHNNMQPYISMHYIISTGETHYEIAQISELKTEINKRITFEQYFENEHPINSLMITMDPMSPKDRYGIGEWEQIDGYFLRAASDTDTGGSATHVHGLTTGAAAINFQGKNTFWRNVNNPAFTSTHKFETSTSTDKTAHSQGMGDSVQLVGNSAAASSLPPYQDVYVWKRIA